MEDKVELERVHKLAYWYEQRNVTHEFTEWALRRRPSSMKAFCNLFWHQTAHDYDDDVLGVMPINNKYIWVNDQAFVRYYSQHTEESCFLMEMQGIDHNFPSTWKRISYVLILKRNKEEEVYYFHVHALTQEAADDCIQFLCSLKDTHFSNVMISREYLRYFSSPAGADQQGNHRFDAFYNLEFSSELQRTMVGASKRILLCHCRFRDGGATVLRELLDAGPDFVPFDLYIEGDCPFDNCHWMEFLKLLSEEKKLVNKLDLRGFTPRPSCRTSGLAFARVGNLIFRENLEESCLFNIIDSVRCGRSPDSLDFKGFDSIQMWAAFGKSLTTSKCRLKRLKVYDLDAERDRGFHDESTLAEALTALLRYALTHNDSLVELTIGFSVITTCEDVLRIVRSVENHKTLRTITFEDFNEWMEVDRKVLTEAWGDILQRNRTIQYIHFDDELYDEHVFARCVRPQLLRNKYLTLIHRSQQMQDVLSRAYFVGKWIEEAVEEHSSPQFTFMLLRMNTDVISSYRDFKY